MIRSAHISDCGQYRYVLRRTWDITKSTVGFIGLNPSTADSVHDDPTIRRCVAFAKSWGFGSIAMFNLFAYRSTDPSGLLATIDIIGPGNNATLEIAAEQCDLIVAAWGNGPLINRVDPLRIERVKKIFPCLAYIKLNADGTPGHPLYLKKDLIPTMWTVSSCVS